MTREELNAILRRPKGPWIDGTDRCRVLSDHELSQFINEFHRLDWLLAHASLIEVEVNGVHCHIQNRQELDDLMQGKEQI